MESKFIERIESNGGGRLFAVERWIRERCMRTGGVEGVDMDMVFGRRNKWKGMDPDSSGGQELDSLSLLVPSLSSNETE